MLYVALKTLHLLSLIVWLGGMFFTLFCLRHAAHTLAPPQRLPMMAVALGRFFNAVAVAAVLLLVTGGAMVGRTAAATKQTGAPFNMPLEWLIMAVLGVVMMLLFCHIRFALYKRLQRAVAAQDWPLGGATMDKIRGWVSINLVIGVVIVVVVMAGTMT
ncbi:MAG: hypothetical protein RLZZ618_1498 [Pseudomonadota bacterium]|jgi:uncharacterized membrane protein